MFRKGIYLVLALCAALCCPTMARADEINYLNSLTNGFETLKGNDISETVTPESDFIEEYQPREVILSVTNDSALPDDATIVQQVNAMTDVFYRVPWGQHNFSMLQFLGVFFTNEAMRNIFFVVAIGLVFMWWGVRKSLRVILSAFRKGQANV